MKNVCLVILLLVVSACGRVEYTSSSYLMPFRACNTYFFIDEHRVIQKLGASQGMDDPNIHKVCLVGQAWDGMSYTVETMPSCGVRIYNGGFVNLTGKDFTIDGAFDGTNYVGSSYEICD